MEEIYKKAAEIIKQADALLIGAGAGIGVDSGLPDFRGNEGFWRAYPPLAKLGVSFEEMANPQWFKKKPRLAWAFYGHRYNLYKKTIPHKGFEILLNIAKSMKNGYFVYTSNVDGQFQKAGFEENKILEIHGSINFFQCLDSCENKIWAVDIEKFEIDDKIFEAIGDLPKCNNCKELARPNILMFGDWNWNSERTNNQHTKFDFWLENLKKNNAKLVVIELGAGISIPSVRMKSKVMIKDYNATLIRINPREADVPENQISIAKGSLEGMEEIYKFL